jgi:hypothetical protein
MNRGPGWTPRFKAARQATGRGFSFSVGPHCRPGPCVGFSRRPKKASRATLTGTLMTRQLVVGDSPGRDIGIPDGHV